MLSFIKDTTLEKTFNIVQKCAWRTAHSYRRELVQMIMARPQGITREGLAKGLDLSLSKVTRMVDDLRRLKVVTNDSKPNNSGAGGRNVHLWYLTPRFRSLIESVSQ